VLQYVTVFCSVLQCIAACCTLALEWCRFLCCCVLQSVVVCCTAVHCVAACCYMLQLVAACCNVVQIISSHDTLANKHPTGARLRNSNQQRLVRVSCSVLQYGVMCCSMLQSVAMCCNVLQCDAVYCIERQSHSSSKS